MHAIRKETYPLYLYLLSSAFTTYYFWCTSALLAAHFFALFAYEFTVATSLSRLEHRVAVSADGSSQSRLMLFCRLEDWNQGLKHAIWFSFYGHLLSPAYAAVLLLVGLCWPLLNPVYQHVMVATAGKGAHYCLALRQRQASPFLFTIVLLLSAVAVFRGATGTFWVYTVYITLMIACWYFFLTALLLRVVLNMLLSISLFLLGGRYWPPALLLLVVMPVLPEFVRLMKGVLITSRVDYMLMKRSRLNLGE